MRYTRTGRYGIDLYVFQLHFVQLVGQFYDAFIFHLEGRKKNWIRFMQEKYEKKKSRKARVVFHNHMRPRQKINVPFTQNDIMRKNGNTKKILPLHPTIRPFFSFFVHQSYDENGVNLSISSYRVLTSSQKYHKMAQCSIRKIVKAKFKLFIRQFFRNMYDFRNAQFQRNGYYVLKISIETPCMHKLVTFAIW